MVFRAMVFGIFLVAGLVARAADPAQSAPEPERWEWSGRVAPGKIVRVENPYGDVRTRFGGFEGAVEIHAVLQNLHPGQSPLQVFTETGRDGLTIRVGRAAATAPPEGRGPKDRVDLAVRVPKGSPLLVVTDAGAIEAKGLLSDVTARSVSGAIVVREVKGLVSTHNRYGTTEVVLEPPPPGSEQTFESLTGDLSITLPARADATVVARTSAWITTDISLDIVRRPQEEPAKTATGKVGTGAARIRLETKRGSLQIFQMDDSGQLATSPSSPPNAASDSDGE